MDGQRSENRCCCLDACNIALGINLSEHDCFPYHACTVIYTPTGQRDDAQFAL